MHLTGNAFNQIFLGLMQENAKRDADMMDDGFTVKLFRSIWF